MDEDKDHKYLNLSSVMFWEMMWPRRVRKLAASDENIKRGTDVKTEGIHQPIRQFISLKSSFHLKFTCPIIV